MLSSRELNQTHSLAGEELWLTKRLARIQRVRVHRNLMANIVARRAKAQAIQSSWIAIAATISVREISDALLTIATKGTEGTKGSVRMLASSFESFVPFVVAYLWCFAITAARCSAMAGSNARSFCCCSCALRVSPRIK